MDTVLFLAFCCGLGLFLLAMRLLVWGLKKLSGNRVGVWLSKTTGSSWRAISTGAAITVALQSSSLVTSLSVGMVESGILGLRQALFITMGANLGTTLIPQLLAGGLPPVEVGLFAAAMIVLSIGRKHTAVVLTAISLLITGMKVMVAAASPLANTVVFQNAVRMMAVSPYLSFSFGLIGAAVFQSSSLVVATVLALARSGSVPVTAAIAVVLGSNVGTCTTALLACVGTNRSARVTAFFHFWYNVAGVVLVFPFLQPIAHWITLTAGDVARQTANAHTLFNLFSILVAWPVVQLCFSRERPAGARRKKHKQLAQQALNGKG